MRYLNVLHVKDSQRQEVQAELDKLKCHNILTDSAFPLAGKWFEREGYAYHIIYSLEPIHERISSTSIFLLDQFTKHIYFNTQSISSLNFNKFMAKTASLGFGIIERVELWKGITCALVPDHVELYSNVFVCDYEKFAELDLDLKKMLVVSASEMKMTTKSYVVRIITMDRPIISVIKHIQVPLIVKDLSGKVSLLRNNVEDGFDDLCWIEDAVARDMAMYYVSKPII